jgi:hypothetical protein
LTWWFHNGDRQCFAQAAAVAAAADIDIGELRRWSKAEGKGREFDLIAERFAARR